MTIILGMDTDQAQIVTEGHNIWTQQENMSQFFFVS